MFPLLVRLGTQHTLQRMGFDGIAGDGWVRILRLHIAVPVQEDARSVFETNRRRVYSSNPYNQE